MAQRKEREGGNDVFMLEAQKVKENTKKNETNDTLLLSIKYWAVL